MGGRRVRLWWVEAQGLGDGSRSGEGEGGGEVGADGGEGVCGGRACRRGRVRYGDDDLDVGLELGFGARWADDDTCILGEAEAQAFGGGQAGRAERQVVDRGDRVAAERTGRGGAEAGHGGGDQCGVVDPEGQLRSGVEAVAAGLGVEEVEQSAALAFGGRRHGGDRQCGADAVLVVDGQALIAAEAVAERLLVAVDQAVRGGAGFYY